MLTLYHSPQSRSSRIVTLLDDLGAKDAVTIRPVTIPRQDGSGGPDADNPHPEGKVPLLVHDGDIIRETTAITLYLTDLFPKMRLGPKVGDPKRGSYLGWLAYYAGVVEPVMVLGAGGIEHPILTVTFRGMPELTTSLSKALEKAPYLLGERYSAADLILSSPFAWFPDATPDVPAIRDWVARSQDRASIVRTWQRDEEWMAAETGRLAN